MQWIINNKEWIFSGIGVFIIGGIIALFKRKQRIKQHDDIGTNVHNIINIENNSNASKQTNVFQGKLNKSMQILFVDDQKFDIVEVLKKAGWSNTKRVKDVTNLDATDVKNSDVIFVDVNGVGCQLFPKDQGLGLAEAIKTKYPQKYIVIYSAVSHHFHKALNVVDLVLEKNADPYEFINILENFINNENTNNR